MVSKESQEKRINTLISEMLAKNEYVKHTEIHTYVSRQLRAFGHDVDKSINTELERLIESLEILEFKYNVPESKEVRKKLHDSGFHVSHSIYIQTKKYFGREER